MAFEGDGRRQPRKSAAVEWRLRVEGARLGARRHGVGRQCVGMHREASLREWSRPVPTEAG